MSFAGHSTKQAHAATGELKDIAWHANASVAEVVLYASQEFPKWLLLFVQAIRDKDGPRATFHLTQMRRVVTAVEKYLRMKRRQWAAEVAEVKTQENTHT